MQRQNKQIQLRISTIGAVAGIAGPILFVAIDLLVAFYNSPADLIQDSISDMALLPLGWVETIGFYILAFATMSLAVGLLIEVTRSRILKLGTGALLIIALGFFFMGTFHTHPKGVPWTFPALVHLASGWADAAFIPITCFFMTPSLKSDPRWNGLSTYTFLTGLFGVGLGILRFALPAELPWFGLYERLLLINGLAWMEVMGIRLLHVSNASRK